MTYQVTAKRWNEGWELHIEGVGVTQCRTLDKAERQARDYIETVLEVENAPIDLCVDLPGDLLAEVSVAREASRAAEAARIDASQRSRAAVRDLRAAGLSITDSAHLTGLSRGRISQLVN